MPRVVQVVEVPGVQDAIATADPAQCAEEITAILAAGADRKEVVRTAALAAARHFRPSLPPPRALLALGASLDLAAKTDPPSAPIVQACALAAKEWRKEELHGSPHAISGDELHLGHSFLVAVRESNVLEADAIFSGLLREGDERRFAGDTLFEACAPDAAGEGHKLAFAVGSWRLARSLGWLRGAAILRPAVHLAAGTTQDLAEFSTIMRDVSRARLDLELAGRNAAPIDAVAKNGWQIALNVGPDRVVTELIGGMKRGRSVAGYADLVAATAMERLAGDPSGMEAALYALAARFVVAFSHTSTRVLAVLQAARSVAKVPAVSLPEAVRVSDPEAALRDLAAAIGSRDARGATRIALGLADAVEPEATLSVLRRQAAAADAASDSGHRLLYASWASEFAPVASGPVVASLAAVLARGPNGQTVSAAI
ncbi:MAG TPA: hypothetical protein VGR51_07250 [Thermoplasmata archaeon]|jgi:hypothetical protein|nr:hypothetical protein [Thermoplasmata archaeon]